MERFSSSEDLSGEENRHRDLVPETQIPDSQRGLDLAFTPPLPPRSRQVVEESHVSSAGQREAEDTQDQQKQLSELQQKLQLVETDNTTLRRIIRSMQGGLADEHYAPASQQQC
eukprot:gene10650-12330_t